MKILFAIFLFLPLAIFSQDGYQINVANGSSHTVAFENELGQTYIASQNLVTLNSQTFSKIRLLRLDGSGEIALDTTYSHTISDEFYPKILGASDNQILLCSETFSYPIEDEDPNRDILVWKIDSLGIINEQKVLSAGTFVDAITLKNGEHVLTGSIFRSSGESIILYKLNDELEIEWTKEFGETYGSFPNTYFDIPFSLQQIGQNIYVNAWLLDFPFTHGKIFKFDFDGDVEWEILSEGDNSDLNRQINSLIKVGASHYFKGSGTEDSYIFDPEFGDFETYKDELPIWSQKGGRNFVNSCAELTTVEISNDTFYLKNYKELGLNYSENVVPNILGNLATLYQASDKGFILLSASSDTLQVTRTDCMGNILNWSGECAETTSETETVSVYPVPSIEEVVIEASFNIERITLFAMNGQVVEYNNTCSCPTQWLDITALSSGVYSLLIEGEESQLISRLIKN